MSGVEQQIKKWYWFNLVILSILLELICEYDRIILGVYHLVAMENLGEDVDSNKFKYSGPLQSRARFVGP